MQLPTDSPDRVLRWLRSERGQTSVEYVGAVLVVCALIAAFVGLVPDVGRELVDHIRHQIDAILGG